MTKDEIISKLSIESDGLYKLVMFDGDQLGFEDAPGIMLMGFSNEDLIENGDIDEDVAHSIQEHEDSIRAWVELQGFKIEEVD